MAYTVELQGENIALVCQDFCPHLYWSRMMELGISASSLCATEMWDSGESQLAEVGVLTISAPSALSVATFSLDIFSGSTMMQR